MSKGEHKILDTRGKFLQAVKDDREVPEADWLTGRVLLSNQRIVLVSNSGKRTLKLSKLGSLTDRMDVNQTATRVSNYLPLRYDDDVILLKPADPEEFETALYKALLDHQTFLVRHPAVEGGVVQDNDWQKARATVEDEAVGLAVADGSFVEVELDDIGRIETADRTVVDDKRTVIEAEHTEEQTSVQTYVSGDRRLCMHLEGLFRKGESRSTANLDLSEEEEEVLMALYSGVSPFEIGDFVDLPVERVEEIYEDLIELEVLEEVRVRREVSLTARGRNLASGAMNDE